MGKPRNVQIHRGDGSTLNCELVHAGISEDGMDHWDIVGVEFHPEQGDHLTADEIPPRTSLGFRMPNDLTGGRYANPTEEEGPMGPIGGAPMAW